jgi:glycosyltransferase involved in cell wall biosynthesis
MKSISTPLLARPPVLLLITNLGLGGAQRVFADHAHLLAHPYKLTECVFNLDQAGDYLPSGDLVELAVPGGGGTFTRIRHFWERCQRLQQLKRTRQIEVAISHLEGADYVNVLSRAGERQILCIHGSKLHDRNIKGVVGWLRQRVLIPWLYRRAACIVTVSTGIRAELVEEMGLPDDKVQVINNFFDDEMIRQRAAELPPAVFAEALATYPVLVTAGRFAPEKNLLALLEIFAQVRQRVPTCKLLLVGQGELYQAILDRCQALSLSVYTAGETPTAMHQAAVLLSGFQANPHAFTARATVFVLPSLNEGFPMALGEAMVCGCPVAAADCPTGPREILAPTTPTPAAPLRQAEQASYGVLLPVISDPTTRATDEQVWADTLVQLLTSPAKREHMGKLAAQRMQDFTRQRIATQWLQLIEQVRHA